MSNEADYFQRLRLPQLFWNVELDKIPDKQHRVVSKYINELPKYLSRGWGLLLWGDYGSGKSGAAAVVMKFGVVPQGRTGMWVFADDIPAFVIEKTMFDDEETMYERMTSVDLLIIDELMIKRKKDSFADTVIEMLFRRRLSARKSTIFTSNISVTIIKEEYPALANVMSEAVYPIKFTGQFRTSIETQIKKDFQDE